MPDNTEILNSIREHRLVDESELTKVSVESQADEPETGTLVDGLKRRGQLTDFQAQCLMEGRGSDLALGTQYVLLDVIGEGGMGQVYKALHRTLKTVRAIKVIRPECTQSKRAVQRFYREMELVAQLNHPNIVMAHDAGEEKGILYFVMELVEGKDLAKLLYKHGRFPIANAAEYTRQAALGLQHAHERGLIHRDIKPSNLLLTDKGGVVKILDLGLARLRETSLEDDEGMPITPTGAVMGTPDFMAPEQTHDAKNIDIRADIYSLGCSLYQLLTRQMPFPGGDVVNKLIRHRQEKPAPVTQFRNDAPPRMLAVLDRMLAKSVNDRFQEPIEVAKALAPFCKGAVAVFGAGTGKAPAVDHTLDLADEQIQTPHESSHDYPGTSFVDDVTHGGVAADSGTALLEPGTEQLAGLPAEPGRKKSPIAMVVGIGLILIAAAVGAFFAFTGGSSNGGAGPQPTSVASQTQGSGSSSTPDTGKGTGKGPPIGVKPDNGGNGGNVKVQDPPDTKVRQVPYFAKEATNEDKLSAGKAKKASPDGLAMHKLAEHKPLRHNETVYQTPRGKSANHATFSGDGKRAALTSKPAASTIEIALIDVEARKQIEAPFDVSDILGTRVRPNPVAAENVTLSSNGRFVLFSSYSRYIENGTGFFDATVLLSRELPRFYVGQETLNAPLGPRSTALAFSRDDKLFFAATLGFVVKQKIEPDDKINVKRARAGYSVSQFERIHHLVCSPDNKLLAAVSNDNVHVASISKDREWHAVLKPELQKLHACFISDDQLLLADGAGNLYAWTVPSEKTNVPVRKPTQTWKQWHKQAIGAIAADPKRQLIATHGEDDQLRLAKLEGKEPTPIWSGEVTEKVLAVAFSADGRYVLYATPNGIRQKAIFPEKVVELSAKSVNKENDPAPMAKRVSPLP